MSTDDDFGPVQRGGPAGTATHEAPVQRFQTDGFGPAQTGRHRRLRTPRPGGIVKGLVITGLVAALVLVTSGAGLLLYTSLRIERIPVTGLAASAPTLNVLVVGSDSREGLSPEELQALGTEAVEGRRTDTIFVLSVDGGRAAMLAFPRDLYVTRCDGTQGRINGAFSSGGPGCLVETVAAASGIPITHYAEIDLAGFKGIVEAVGGVTLFLDEPLVDRFAGVDLPAGCVLLDGNEALGFVRARRVDNDLGRIARQQRFLSELADEVTSPATLLNPARLIAVAGAAGEALTADTGLGVLELVRLGRAARGLAGAGLATYTVPAVPEQREGAAVLVPQEAEAEALFAQFRDGSILTTAAAQAPGSVTPADVTVAVRNGAGQAGLAGTVAEALRNRGFTISDVGNADRVEQTVVRHAPGMEAAAALVAATIPGATTAADDSAEGVVLVLGPGAGVAEAPPAPPAPPASEAPVGAAPPPPGC